MVNTRDAIPPRSEQLQLRSGLYIVEFYDQDEGGVSAQARGPMQPRTGDAAWIGAGDAGPGIIARALGATDDKAMEALTVRLRAMKELP